MNTTSSPNTSTLLMPVTKRAHGRSLADFGELLQAEETLLASSALGEVAKIGDDVPADESDPNKVIRASFLRFLLLSGDEQAPVHEQGVQLSGAWIQDPLDLANCVVPHGMNITKCRFDQPIIAIDARITGLLNLSGCHLLQGLRADRLRCDSGVFLRDGFRSFGVVRLSGGEIGGNLECSGSLFEAEEGPSLYADGAVINGDVFLDNQFKANGTVRLLGTQIGGSLTCSGGHFLPKEGYALTANGVVVKGDVFLNNQFKANGTVWLLGARIGGDLDCSGSLFESEDGPSLSADNAFINGSFYLNEHFKTNSEVRLLGAEIGANLACSDGQFEPPKGYALLFDRAVIKGNVLLNNQFKATGEVRLLSAQIGGQLTCSGGQFSPPNGDALSADSAVIKGDVFLNNQFNASGAVRLLGTQINGDLDCSLGKFSDLEGNELILQIATIRKAFILRDVVVPVRINAAATDIGVLLDTPTAWAKGSILNGLVYRSLTGTAPTDAASRISWLRQQSDKDLGEDDAKQGFRPQPWKQLQKVLREMGHDADARDVGIAFENQLRKADRIGQITDANKAKKIIPVVRRQCLRALHWLFGALAGYGYRPLRLFMSMVAVWLFCAFVYWWLALTPHSALGPTDPLVFQNDDYAACTAAFKGNWFLCGPLPAEYTTFSPLAYSLDILLPLVDLGQEKSWGPLVPTPEQHIFVELFSFSPAHWVRLLNWFEILFGWVASLLFVAIVSGMSRRSEMDK